MFPVDQPSRAPLANSVVGSRRSVNNPTPQITNTKFIELLKTYWAWRRLWIATTVAFGGLGLVYVLVLKNDMWTASQGLIVRDEANGAVMRLGRFQSQTEMKAAQETILEMARNTQVLREALLEVGPAKSFLSFNKISDSWPSQREVSELAEDSIGVRAPQGAEFGTTEVIYLDIKQHTRDRSLELNKAVCKALDNRLRQVRVARADGVINELVRASSMATEDLKKASDQLQIVEREAGADLADLRGLSEANGSGSASRTQLENVKTELRQVETLHASLLSDLALLKETQADPERLLSAPASILSAHPGLRKLREGLADAQLNTSQLRGRFTSSHPLVFVATSAESEIKQQLQTELAQATSNSQREVTVSQARLDKLKKQQQQLEDRLERLARIRTEHEQLNQEVRSRTRILQDAERQLADTRAARDAALTTSLLTRIDDPVLGERPVGPGRTTILAAMTMAGLCFGLGIVFLLTPLDGSAPDSGRWNEQLGRRLSDRFPWLADQGAGNGPRRRRNDADRRSERGTAAQRSTDAVPRGRRQSDQLIAATTAPEIKDEDPSVASRLDDMLRSELAAMAPVAVQRQDSPEVATGPKNEATVDRPELVTSNATTEGIVTSDDPAMPLPDRAAVAVASMETATQVLATALTESQPQAAHADPVAVQGSKASVKEPVRPRLRTRDAAALVKPTKDKPQVVEPPATQPVMPMPRPVANEQPRPVQPKPVQPKPQKPVQTAPRPAPIAPVMAAQPIPTQTMNEQSVLQPTPESRPVNQNTNIPAQRAAAAPAKPTKPVMNLFKPNQALGADAKPATPRPTGFKPPIEPAPAPKPAPIANSFETPPEGGLAGIGLPTQKLPDSFQFRQGS